MRLLVLIGALFAALPPASLRADGPGADPALLSGHLSGQVSSAADALDVFDLTVEGRRCLDAGASTGGFTDVGRRQFTVRCGGQYFGGDISGGRAGEEAESIGGNGTIERTTTFTVDVDEIQAIETNG